MHGLLRGTVFFLLVLGFSEPAAAQTRMPLTEVPLASMQAFRGPAVNWQVAGAVYSDPNRRWSLETEPGTGVLVNQVTEDANANLFTTWEHGDIELELEVMMPKGSNSGIYLQGRYEVQLLDSWGVPTPTFGDGGGIYERWDESRPEGRRGYEGHPPRVNVSRAPGLWQHFKIIFHAPRFDASGTKTANARFARVEHNGVVIHENVEVTGPTRAAAFDDEQPAGPLMFQGDHGPVAFRNIRYKRYGAARLRLTDLHYQVREGRFERLPAPMTAPGEPLDGLTGAVSPNPDTFAVQFDGTLHVPTGGTHRFTLALDWITGDPHFRDKMIGGGVLSVGGRQALMHEGTVREAGGQIDLDAGTHPFRLMVFKNRQWHAPQMALYVEGPDTPLHTLNAPGSLPPPSPVGAIPVAPAREPVVLRSFIAHRGATRTHAVSVGGPGGLHYSYDTQQAALLHLWRGPFLDATPMWHSRGQDQLAVPQGSIITLSGQPTLAFLDDTDAAWPDSIDHAMPYRFQGYDLDPDGHPVFRYTLGPVTVQDRTASDEEALSLTRQLTLHAEDPPATLWLRVVAGTTIHEQTNEVGRFYLIDGPTYYVYFDNSGGATPVIRATADGQELLVPVRFEEQEATITYSFIW